MKRFVVECGTSRSAVPEAIVLNIHGTDSNVKLRVDYISRTLLVNLPDLLVDLLEIASYVYCADQRIGRGSLKLTGFGADWRRSLCFKIPVRQIEVWEQRDVQKALVTTLGFLSDDSYEFEFRKYRGSTQQKSLYFDKLIDTAMENEEVSLFSGGVDSFAGAVNDIVNLGKTVTLVGHYSSSKVREVQSDLVERLKEEGLERKFSYVPVWVSNENEEAREFTQRTRSFLFACLGFVIARLSGKSSFNFYENGVVSINPPLAGDVVGGRATRTTHPKVLRGFEEIFSTILNCRIEIKSPLQWMTKKEVTELIEKAGLPQMLPRTVSCTRPRMWTKQQKHCGRCSQCIDRRFGVIAAGMAVYEPSGNYMRDLFVSGRSEDEDLRMALSYVNFYRQVSQASKEQLLVQFPQIVSALDHFPGLTPSEAAERIYSLFQRQAEAVQTVVTDALAENRVALYRQEIPPNSLLAACSVRGRIEVEPPTDYADQAKAFLDRLSAPLLEFAFDEEGKRVLFHGGTTLSGANYRLVQVLIDGFRRAKREGEDVPYRPAAKVEVDLEMTQQSMRQQISRLRKALEPLVVSLGIPLDQDTFVQTKERAGYRLNPALREISIGDIRRR